MSYQAYAYYNIWFTDVADYEFAIAVAGGYYVNLAPNNAAALFDIPIPYPSGDMSLINKTITFNSGFSPGDEINNPLPSGIFLDEDVDVITVPSTGGNPASSFPPGEDLIFTWSGIIMPLNVGGGENPAPPNYMSQRRWIQGYELAPLGEGGTSGNTNLMSRVGSRTNGGHGYVVRGQNIGVPVRRNVADYRIGLATATSWERFYFRLRVPGSSTCGLWKTFGFPTFDFCAALEINTDGSIRVEMINSVGVKVVVATIPALDLNTWYRFDIFLRYDDTPPGPVTNGRLTIYINGIFILTYHDINGSGLGGGTRHVSTDIGKWTPTVDNQIEYDVDDWINADLPANVSPTSCLFTDGNYPFDWLVGSHIRSVLSLSATTVGWAPTNREVLNQGAGPTPLLAKSLLNSTTSGATIDGITDHNNDQDEIAQKYGPVCAVVGDKSTNAGALGDRIGYRIAGGVSVMTLTTPSGIAASYAVGYTPSGLLLPPDIVPFHVVKTKSLDAASATTLMLQGAIEYLGAWGPEDGADTQVNTQDFLHNCRYTGTLWGYLGGYTDGPVFTKGGTYVGNGTFQDINLPGPCHFLIIRPPNGVASNGIRFFGSSVVSSLGETDQGAANVRIWMDNTGQVKFTVSGVDPNCNQNAQTYQYIAFCDPGMRYNICGAYNHPQAGTSPRTNDLSYINSDWTPEFAWIQNVFPDSTSSTNGLSIKGPSSVAGVNGVTVRGVAIAQFGRFSPGSFESRSGIHYNTPSQVNYSLWRKADDVCGDIMLQIFSYIGNGSGGTRIIPFPDVTGRFPIFAHVQPANAIGIFRDPSHIGTESASATTMNNAANGIVAGAVDSISVGSVLNANGINYDVFIILGSDVGWLNGTYYPPDCEGAYQPPPAPPLPEIAVRAEGGLILGGTTAITLLKDVSGIYTLVPGKTDDTFIDRSVGVEDMDVKIPDPLWKTGYIGG